MTSPLGQRVSSGGGSSAAGAAAFLFKGVVGAAAAVYLNKEVSGKMREEMKPEKSGTPKSSPPIEKARSQASIIGKVWVESKEKDVPVKKNSIGALPGSFKNVIRAASQGGLRGKGVRQNLEVQAREKDTLEAQDPGVQTCRAYEKEASKLQEKILGETAPSDVAKAVFSKRVKGASALKIPVDHEINKILAESKQQKWVGNLDSGAVAHGNMRVQKRNVEGSEKSRLEIKLNAPYREKLNADLSVIKNNRAAFAESVKTASALAGTTGVTIRSKPYLFMGKNEKGVFTSEETFQAKEQGSSKPKIATEIHFEGVGKVILVDRPKLKAIYSNIVIEIDDNHPNPAEAAQQMLAMLGVGPIVYEQGKNDEARLKLAIAFRENHPSEAASFERTPEFFSLSPSQLRDEMIKLAPSAKETFEKYIDTPGMMVQESTYGHKEWGLADMDKRMAAQGALGLMMGVKGYGTGTPMEQAARAFVGMLMDDGENAGAKSTLERMTNGKIIRGASSDIDLMEPNGSYSRTVNEQNLDVDIEHYALSGNIAILISLAAAITGCHMNEDDVCGRNDKARSMPETTKLAGEMLMSKSEQVELGVQIAALREKIKTAEAAGNLSEKNAAMNELGALEVKLTTGTFIRNEVVKKGGIPATYHTGVVVATDEKKNEFMGHVIRMCMERLDKANVDGMGSVTRDSAGDLSINGTKLDEYVKVGEKFSKEMFATPS